MKTVTITVATDGSSRVETKGFVGKACREASQFLEEALGRKTGERLTAPFHQSVQTETEHRLRS